MKRETKRLIMVRWHRYPVELQKQLLQKYEEIHGDSYSAQSWLDFLETSFHEEDRQTWALVPHTLVSGHS